MVYIEKERFSGRKRDKETATENTGQYQKEDTLKGGNPEEFSRYVIRMHHNMIAYKRKNDKQIWKYNMGLIVQISFRAAF